MKRVDKRFGKEQVKELLDKYESNKEKRQGIKYLFNFGLTDSLIVHNILGD